MSESGVFLRKLEKLTGDLASSSEDRESLETNLFTEVDNLLKDKVAGLQYGKDSECTEIATILRFLRNALAGCERNQSFVRESSSIVPQVERILELVLERMRSNLGIISEHENVMVRCGAQFLCNFVAGNATNAECVGESLLPLMFGFIKTSVDDKIVQYFAMTLHMVFKILPSLTTLDDEVANVLIRNAESEFVMYLIETLVTSEIFMTVNFNELKAESRTKLIQIIVSHTEIHSKLPITVIKQMSVQFQKKSDLILNTKFNDEWTAWEIVSLLELLCIISSQDDHCLKTDSALVTTAMYLLKSVHSAGKCGSGNFEPITDADAMKPCSSTDPGSEISGTGTVQEKPTFRFKANLIRFVANLIHQNHEYQDLVRETETLAVILDCSSIDARNPFITQWAVLAIRNACEGNLANQEVVRSLQKLDTETLLSSPKVQNVQL